MPDYNLGTAHGRIKIDVDDRGAKQAQTSVETFERSMQKLDRRLSQMQLSLNKIETELGNLSREIGKANDEAEKFDKSLYGLDDGIVNVSGRTRGWTQDLRVMTYEIKRAVNAADTFLPPLLMMGKTISGFRKSNGGAGGFLSALSGAGVIAAGVGALGNKLIGVDKAMQRAPQWQKSVVGLSHAFGRLLALGSIGQALKTFTLTNKIIGGLFKTIGDGFKGIGGFTRLDVFKKIGGMFHWLANGAHIASNVVKSSVDRISGNMRLLSHITGFKVFDKFGRTLNAFATSSGHVARGFRNMLGGATSFFVGLNLMKSSLRSVVEAYRRLGWAGRMAVAALGALGTVGPAALELLSKGLVKASNLILGLVDGIKQLSGGILALPGFFSMIFASVSSLGFILKGIGEQFKDIFSTDPAKFAEAMAAMPPHLKPLAVALSDAARQFRVIKTFLQADLLAGLDKQVTALAVRYLPILDRSMSRVALSFRTAKDRLVEFLMTSETGRDVGQLYGSTAQAVNLLSAALKPVMAGFRDISIVGAKFINELLAGVPRVANGFAKWAETNRKNGNLMRWMRESWAGTKDLLKGLRDLGKATLTLFTLFADRSGENWLSRFANAMAKFNETVQRSASIGVLKEIGDAVRNMGTEHWETFTEVMQAAWDTMKAGWPVVKALGEQIGNVMSAALRHVLHTFELFFGMFNKQADFSIIDGFVDMMGNFYNAIKFSIQWLQDFTAKVKNAMGAVGEFLGILVAWFSGFRVLQGLFNALSPVVSFLFRAFQEMLSALVPIAGVVLGLALAWGTLHKLMAPIKGVIKFVAGFITTIKGLGTAVMGAIQALGMFGPAGAKAAVVLRGLALAVAGVTAALAVMAIAWTVWKAGQSQIENANKAISDSSDNTRESVKRLKKAFVADGGLAGENVFTAVRDSAQQTLDDLENISDNAVGSLGQMTDFLSGGNGETIGSRLGLPDSAKWQAFIQGIPIVGSFLNSATGSSNQVNRLQEMATAAKEAKTQFESLGWGADELQRIITGSADNFDRHRKILESDGEKAEEAVKHFDALRQQYLETEAAAQQLGTEGVTLLQGLEELAGAAGNADKQFNGLKKVLVGLGIIETDSLDAAFAWTKGLEELAKGYEVVIAAGTPLSEIIDKTTNSFNTNSGAAAALYDQIKPLGDQFLNNVLKGKADPAAEYARFIGDFTKMVDAINAESQRMGQGVAINEEQMRRLAEAVGLFKPEDLMAKLDQVLTPEQKKLMAEFELDEQSIQKAREQIQQILDPTKPVEGNQETKDKDKLVNVPVELDPKSNEKLIGDIEELMKNAKDTVDEKSRELEKSGALFGEAFAAGITSSQNTVDAAARALVTAAMFNYHQSPPKKGPLAKHGDAIKYAGTVFAKQYAAGITTASDTATNAAANMARNAYNGTAQGMPGETNGAGEFFGQLLELTNFASRVNDIFQKVSDTVMRTVKFISDPLGKGTFFGKNLGFRRTVSDEELQRQADDRNQNAFTNVFESGRRPTDTLDAYGMPKITGPGALQRDASQSDVQAAIVAEGQRRGLGKEAIISALAIASQESNYGQNNFGAGQGAFLPGGGKGNAYGVFQQTPEGGWGTPEQLTDPNYAISKFFDAYEQRLATTPDPLTAAILTQNPQLGSNARSDVYGQTANSKLGEAAKVLSQVLSSGSTLPTQSGMVMPGVGAFPNLKSSKLQDTDGRTSKPWVQQAAAILETVFPNINSIGGARDDPLPNHPDGLALDIGIGEVTEENQRMGDIINAYVRQNAAALGVESTIWRDTWMDFKGNVSDGQTGHQNHIHIKFNDGGVANIGPNGTNLTMPYGLQGLMPDSAFGPPLEPGSTVAPPGETVMINPDGTVTRVHGENKGMPGEPLNRATGKPWTEEEAQAYFDQNKKQFDLGELTPEAFKALYDNNNFVQGTSEEIAARLQQDPRIAEAYAMQAQLALDPKSRSENEIATTLSALDESIVALRDMDTPGSRAQASALESVQSSIMGSAGFSREANPIDQVAGIVSQVAGVTSDIIGSITSGIEAIGAADSIAKQLVYGVRNTEDVGKIIDDVQKFIEFGANIAGSVASVTGLAASLVGAGAAGDPSGGASGVAAALGSVSTIASLVQAGLETTNAVIDLTQEAVRIVGTYVGDFLGYLVGGPGGQLTGNVKFLLDEQTNQLLSYTAENAMDKRVSNIPFAERDFASREQLIGNINVYGGPGSDPRDLTRQMMFQVNSAQYAGALAY